MKNHPALSRSLLATLLLSATTNLFAAMTTYTYTVTGDVLEGNSSTNIYGLAAGDIITASGTFTVDSSIFSGVGGVVTLNGITNTMVFETGTPWEANYSVGPNLTFNASGQLTDFYYPDPNSGELSSSFMQFDDFYVSNLYGEWRTNATVTAVPVPEPETYAMMLAGLGMVGFMGMARRKSLQTA